MKKITIILIALLTSVFTNTFAQENCVKEGDIITKIGDKKIEDADDLTDAVQSHKPGDKVTVTYLRDGKEQTLDFTFSIDSSNVDQYKEASPENKVETDENNRGSLNPFSNMP